jgi:hypothetical protein
MLLNGATCANLLARAEEAAASGEAALDMLAPESVADGGSGSIVRAASCSSSSFDSSLRPGALSASLDASSGARASDPDAGDRSGLVFDDDNDEGRDDEAGVGTCEPPSAAAPAAAEELEEEAWEDAGGAGASDPVACAVTSRSDAAAPTTAGQRGAASALGAAPASDACEASVGAAGRGSLHDTSGSDCANGASTGSNAAGCVGVSRAMFRMLRQAAPVAADHPALEPLRDAARVSSRKLLPALRGLRWQLSSVRARAAAAAARAGGRAAGKAGGRSKRSDMHSAGPAKRGGSHEALRGAGPNTAAADGVFAAAGGVAVAADHDGVSAGAGGGIPSGAEAAAHRAALLAARYYDRLQALQQRLERIVDAAAALGVCAPAVGSGPAVASGGSYDGLLLVGAGSAAAASSDAVSGPRAAAAAAVDVGSSASDGEDENGGVPPNAPSITRPGSREARKAGTTAASAPARGRDAAGALLNQMLEASAAAGLQAALGWQRDRLHASHGSLFTDLAASGASACPSSGGGAAATAAAAGAGSDGGAAAGAHPGAVAGAQPSGRAAGASAAAPSVGDNAGAAARKPAGGGGRRKAAAAPTTAAERLRKALGVRKRR